MLGLVLSILLVVLVSGAVLWVVDGEQGKPRSGAPELPAEDVANTVDPAVDVALATIPHAPAARVRQPATSRRIPRAPETPPEEPQWRAAAPAVLRPEPAPVASRTVLAAVRTLDPQLPRHRLRSAILLVGLVVLVGALLAAVIGIVVSALAFALRAAVTS